jgi:hypothetical protein
MHEYAQKLSRQAAKEHKKATSHKTRPQIETKESYTPIFNNQLLQPHLTEPSINVACYLFACFD